MYSFHPNPNMYYYHELGYYYYSYYMLPCNNHSLKLSFMRWRGKKRKPAQKIGIIYRPSDALISKYRHRHWPEKNPYRSTSSTKTRTSCLNQMRQSERSFSAFVLMTDSSAELCQKVNAHLYTVSSVDKIAAVIVISIWFWRDMTLAFSVIKC